MIQNGRLEGLLLIKQRLYDETPLRLRHDAEKGQIGITKVLQTQFRLAMLLREPTSKKLLYLHGYVPVVLQALETKKAEDIMCAQLRVEQSIASLNRCCEHFDLCVQLLTTDRDGTNLKAERGIQHLNPKFAKVHLPCDVHKVSTCLTSMLNLVPAAVTGIVNIGLMLRPAGAVQKFRLCLMQEIESRFQVVIGLPPAGHAKSYRMEVYKLFLGSSHSNEDTKKKHQLIRVSQLQVLSFFLNGDLQDENHIVWHAPFNISQDDAMVLVKKYVPHALLPVAVSVFPRHRWHGCEIPVDQLALLAAHHNLLKHATLRFLGYDPKNDVNKTKTDNMTHGGWSDAAKLCLENSNNSADVSENPDGQPRALLDAEPQPPPESSAAPPSWEEFNRSVRAKVKAWVLQDGHNCLPVLRLGMGAAVRLMFKFLQLSGHQWDAEQEDSLLTSGARSYRVVEAFKGEDVAQAFDHVTATFHASISALPMRDHTVASCGLLYRLLARFAGALHLQVRRPRQVFPYKLFGCLHAGSGVSIQSVVDSPKCLHDDITQKIVGMMGSEPSESDIQRARSELLVLADLSMVDIANVESRHASIRRGLEGSSVQTWRANLSKLSAEWTIRQSNARRSLLHRRLFNIQQKKKAPGRKRKGNTTGSKKRCGGGAHRAFMRAQLLAHGSQARTNTSTLFKEINQKYRSLSPEELAHYTELGEAGTIASRAGYKSFGAKRSQSGRKLDRSVSLPAKRARQNPQKPLRSSSALVPVPDHNALPSQVNARLAELSSGILRKRKHASRCRDIFATKRAKMDDNLRAFARNRLGYKAECPPVAEENALDDMLEESMLPHATEIPHCDCFEVFPKNAKIAKDVLSSDSGLQERLIDDWEERHSLLSHEEVQAMPARPAILTEPSECSKLQWCVCGGDKSSLDAYRFHQNLVKLMKPFVVAARAKKGEKKPKPTPQRTLLEDGFLIIKLSPEDSHGGLGQDEQNSWMEAIQDIVGQEQDSVCSPVWLHVCHVNFQSYEICVLELQDACDDAISQLVGGRAMLKVPDKVNCCTLKEYALRMNLQISWIAQWYSIEETSAKLDLSRIKADQLIATPMSAPNIPDFRAWKGSDREQVDIQQALQLAIRQQNQQRRDRTPAAASSRGSLPKSHGAQPALTNNPDADLEDEECRQEEENEEEEEQDPLSEMIEWAHEAASAFLEDEAVSNRVRPVNAAVAPTPKPKPNPNPASSSSKQPTPSDSQPDPAAEAASRKPADSRKKEVSESVLQLPGFGDLRFNPRSKLLVAHCSKHGLHTCKRSRTVVRPEKVTIRNSGQGRPLGHLMAWLMEQSKHSTQKNHVASPVQLNFDARRKAREYLKKVSGSGTFFDFERPKGDNSDSEPDVMT
eukprot:Skav204463  [mRNA]  locus=scaffold3437:21493:25999:+ [translate_table: standard]